MIIEQGNVIHGLILTVLGMGVVFIVLIAINFAIAIMGRIVNGTAKKQAPPPAANKGDESAAPAAAPAAQTDPGELIAVITAAVSACMRGGSASKLPLTVAPYITSGGWASAAKNENTQKL